MERPAAAAGRQHTPCTHLTAPNLLSPRTGAAAPLRAHIYKGRKFVEAPACPPRTRPPGLSATYFSLAWLSDGTLLLLPLAYMLAESSDCHTPVNRSQPPREQPRHHGDTSSAHPDRPARRPAPPSRYSNQFDRQALPPPSPPPSSLVLLPPPPQQDGLGAAHTGCLCLLLLRLLLSSELGGRRGDLKPF